MKEPGVRVTWRERAVGDLDGGVRLDLVVEVPDALRFMSGAPRRGMVAGRVRGPSLGDALLEEGSVMLEDRALVYDAAFVRDGRALRLRARRAAGRDGSALERLRPLGRLEVELDGRTGALRTAGRCSAPLSRIAVTNAPRGTGRRVRHRGASGRRGRRRRLGQP